MTAPDSHRDWQTASTTHGLFNLTQCGGLVFFASLVVLMILPRLSTTPRQYLNLRIFILGTCVGGLLLSRKHSVATALAAALGIWAPKPILEWRRQRAAKLASHQPANPLKPAAAFCSPRRADEVFANGTNGNTNGVLSSMLAFARAWYQAWIGAHVSLFKFVFSMFDRFNERVFSLLIRFLERQASTRAQSHESVHEAVARGDVRKVEKLLRSGKTSASEVGDAGRTLLHVALERLEEVATEIAGDAEEGPGEAGATDEAPGAAAQLLSHEAFTMLRWLLHYRADVHAADAHERTPIHIAVRAGLHEAARRLIDAGADATGAPAFSKRRLTLPHHIRLESSAACIRLGPPPPASMHPSCLSPPCEFLVACIRLGRSPPCEHASVLLLPALRAVGGMTA